jgi:hypothetical protein
VVINLTSVTTSTFVPAVLRWMTQPEHWSACAPCPLLERCPAYFNAQRLSDPLVVERVALLYQLLEHLDIHVTVRDMLIHLAYTLTGDKRCPELQRMASARKDMHELAYYATVWGGALGSAFRRKASVPQHLEKFHVGEHSLFEVDDFIVSRGEGLVAQAEHDRIFADGVDLDGRRFAQDRVAYVEGGADRQADEEARILLEWLPHCRRKLFFELRDTERVMQLISFLHIGTYLRLLAGDRDVHDQVRASLVLGLNRAFSRLYLTEDQNLYVTTQYLHSAEQSRPLVRLTLPTSGIMLRVDSRPDEAVDRAWPELSLIFGAPAALILRDPDAARAKQSWHLNLMLFEYLMRLADGGTFNILAAECELIVRALKDNLLSAFAREHDSRDSIEFFVTDRRQYSLKKLRIDEHTTIRSGG